MRVRLSWLALLAACNAADPVEGSGSGDDTSNGTSGGTASTTETTSPWSSGTDGDGTSGSSGGGGSDSSSSDGGTATETGGGTTDTTDGGTPSTGGSSTSTSTTSDGSTTGTSTTTHSGPITVEYVAVIAECVDLANLDPDLCEQNTGASQLQIDGYDNVPGAEVQAFFRFDLDDAFAGLTVTAVTLRLVVPDTGTGNSDETGEVWAVEPFVRSDLFVATPAPVGASALAPDQGPASLGDTITWSLPPGAVAPDTPLHLGLYPVTQNGVTYWDETGAYPPTLIIDAM